MPGGAMPSGAMPPGAMPAGGYVPPRLTPPASRQPAPRVARGVRPNEPTVAPKKEVLIPTPEELGIKSASRTGESTRSTMAVSDLSKVRHQLTELGIVRYQVEYLSGGRVRFSCWLPGSNGQLIQEEGRNETEALQLCLERVKAVVVSRR